MSNTPRKVSIFGSTGSIGIQSLDVISHYPDNFVINYITTNTRIDILTEQINQFKPKSVVITDEKSYKEFKSKNYSFDCRVLFGEDGLLEAASDRNNDLLISALVGFSGVLPTLKAIQNGTEIALANKETLVSAGSVIMKEAAESNVRIIAIDSEHSAILQCMAGESIEQVEKIILTASGGPFRYLAVEEFENITVEQALKHPNWSMGSKITIDSATMMNKGFEVIEAYWLFGLNPEQIEVIIHPQSIIHSLVQFIDGSIKAQLGPPDMRIPISYALTIPVRRMYNFQRLDFKLLTELSFLQPDYNRYPCLRLSIEALRRGGTSATILNAANEAAVYAFLKKKLKFNNIASVIEKALSHISIVDSPDLNDILDADRATRVYTESLIY